MSTGAVVGIVLSVLIGIAAAYVFIRYHWSKKNENAIVYRLDDESDDDADGRIQINSRSLLPSIGAPMDVFDPHSPRRQTWTSIRASDMRTSDAERIAVMKRVKEGELSVDQAMEMLERREDVLSATARSAAGTDIEAAGEKPVVQEGWIDCKMPSPQRALSKRFEDTERNEPDSVKRLVAPTKRGSSESSLEILPASITASRSVERAQPTVLSSHACAAAGAAAQDDSAAGLFGVVDLEDIDDPIAAATTRRGTADVHNSSHTHGSGIDLESLRKFASSVGDEISTYRPSATSSKSALDRRTIPATVSHGRGQSVAGTPVERHGTSAQRSEGRYRGGIARSTSRNRSTGAHHDAPTIGQQQQENPVGRSDVHFTTDRTDGGNVKPRAMGDATEVHVMANVCGDRDVFSTAVGACDALVWHNGTLMLSSPSTQLVFCGNAVGMGNADMTVAKALLQLKKQFPDRVHLLAGGMDVVALRCTSELAEGETGAKTDVYWKSDCMTYKDFLKVRQLEDGTVATAKWIFECTLDRPDAFEDRRAELETEYMMTATDNEVVASFVDAVDPKSDDPWLLDYLRQCTLATVVGRTLYTPGLVTKQSLGVIPGSQLIFTSPREWVHELNAFFAAELANFEARPRWLGGNFKKRRGGEALMDYGLPGGFDNRSVLDLGPTCVGLSAAQLHGVGTVVKVPAQVRAWLKASKFTWVCSLSDNARGSPQLPASRPHFTGEPNGRAAAVPDRTSSQRDGLRWTAAAVGSPTTQVCCGCGARGGGTHTVLTLERTQMLGKDVLDPPRSPVNVRYASTYSPGHPRYNVHGLNDSRIQEQVDATGATHPSHSLARHETGGSSNMSYSSDDSFGAQATMV
eukprot:m.261033 g.261033  ORF g.261033 m.261033 type:complete len:862 (+) comp19686_c0_seq2:271-2856(+)